MGCVALGSWTWRVIAAILPVLAGIGFANGGPALSSRQAPATAPSTSPSGKWSCWSEEKNFSVRAATPKALWLAGWSDNHLVRYDLNARKTQVFSVFDGLPFEEFSTDRIVGAKDERCAILIHRDAPKNGMFLWRPSDGWEALPPVGIGNHVRDIAFDQNDNLLALSTFDKECRISRFDGRKWNGVCLVPDADFFMPIKDGYMLVKMSGDTKGIFVPESDPSKTSTTQLKGMNRYHLFYLWSGDKTLCLPESEKAFNITSSGFSEYRTGKYLGFDLKARDIIDCDILETTDTRVRVRPNVPDAPVVETTPFSWDSFQPLRDPNGHLWKGCRRWDGREWKNLCEGFSVPPQFRYETNLVELSADGASWTVLNPDLPPSSACYNHADRTAWVVTSYKGKGELQFIRQDGKNRQVLRTIPYDTYIGLPKFQTPDGDWWWHGKPYGYKDVALRLTSEGIKEYPNKGFDVYLSPLGTVWCAGNDVPYTRFDPKSDSFVNGEPWDDFSFDFGKWKLAHMYDINSPRLYKKTDAGWVPFRSPFSGHDDGAYGRRIVYKDRLLVTVLGVGVMEYNASLDKWTRLTDSWQRACYDARGRRILWGFGLLVYDGDPWDGQQQDQDEAVFARLIEQMDSDRWKVREEATRMLAADLDKFRFRIKTAVDDQSLSTEVRTRLLGLLPGDDKFMPPPPALFRARYPLLIPKNP